MFTIFRRRQIHSFDEDAALHGPVAQRSIGTHPVALRNILGSVGRAHELRADFRSFHTWDGELRYHHVRQIMKEGKPLPPVQLYKLLDRYYVVDGNHRVAAARSLGLLDIDAEVTEFRPIEATGIYADTQERESGE